jgi:hypothetical protein
MLLVADAGQAKNSPDNGGTGHDSDLDPPSIPKPPARPYERPVDDVGGHSLDREHIGVKMGVTDKRFVAAQGCHAYILVFALGFIPRMMTVVGLLGLA